VLDLFKRTCTKDRIDEVWAHTAESRHLFRRYDYAGLLDMAERDRSEAFQSVWVGDSLFGSHARSR